MSEIISAPLRPSSSAWHIFRVVFAIVFVLVLGASTLATFLIPKSYASTARIRVERVPVNTAQGRLASSPEAYDPHFLQTEMEVLQSTAVLGWVVEKLNLNVEWGGKYNGGEKLHTTNAVAFLQRRINVIPDRNTQRISITVYDGDPNEAARLANAITDAYRVHRSDLREIAAGEKSTSMNAQVTSMEVIRPAEPELVPIRPYLPWHVVIGALNGILLGAIIGGVSLYAVSWYRREAQKQASRRNTPAETSSNY
jgi:uncharacterized protein involved in exopolysaccharide biosynthesis